MEDWKIAISRPPTLLEQIHQSTPSNLKEKHQILVTEYQAIQKENEKLRKDLECAKRKRDLYINQAKENILQIKREGFTRDEINLKVKNVKTERNALNKLIKLQKRLNSASINELKETASSLHGQVKLLASENREHHNKIKELNNDVRRKKNLAIEYANKIDELGKKLILSRKSKNRLRNKVSSSRGRLRKHGISIN